MAASETLDTYLTRREKDVMEGEGILIPPKCAADTPQLFSGFPPSNNWGTRNMRHIFQGEPANVSGGALIAQYVLSRRYHSTCCSLVRRLHMSHAYIFSVFHHYQLPRSLPKVLG